MKKRLSGNLHHNGKVIKYKGGMNHADRNSEIFNIESRQCFHTH